MIQDLIQWSASFGGWGVFVALLFSILFNILGVIPGAVVTGVFVLLWGPLAGGSLAWLGEVLGSGIAFLLLRRGYRGGTGKDSPDWRWVRSLNHWPRRRQFLSLLSARLLPFVPAGAINILGALTCIRFGDYLLATALGKLPSTALEVLIAHDLIQIREHSLRLGLVLVVLIGVWWTWRRR
ncbi:putative membrane protein YdjX (TVP38/TMEM64 family) [Kroppenstedtia sanguinis]|uniref:TVP38/TMEM64 family membrane protein n=1 Tax=Kroppenstedtia sanguinis TaxID=1380684 RepID=A0ABW4CAZ3_9BACL